MIPWSCDKEGGLGGGLIRLSEKLNLGFKDLFVENSHSMYIYICTQKSLIEFIQFFAIPTTKLNLRFRYL